MLGDEESEVGVFGVFSGVFVAVAVDGDDAVGVFVDDDAVGVHAEGADEVLELFGTVDDLAFVEVVGEVGEDLSGELDAHADIYAVGFSGDIQTAADGFHPFTAASPDGDDALAAGEGGGAGGDDKAVIGLRDIGDGGIEVEIDLILKLGEDIVQDGVVDIGAEVAHLGVEKVETVLQADFFDIGIGGGIEPGVFAAVRAVDIVDIAHELDSVGFADVFIEGSAELVSDVIFSVGECAGAAEAAHNGAGGAVDAGFYINAVDRAFTLLKGSAELEDGDGELRGAAGELEGGEDAAGTCADDNDVIKHRGPP